MQVLYNKKLRFPSINSEYLAYFAQKETTMTHTGEFQIEGDLRLIDVINSNERLLLIIERLGIPLGFGDKTIIEVCNEYNLNPSLVLIVMNIFNNNLYPTEGLLSETMIPALIEYLKNGHRYYLAEKLPFISEMIDRFIENTDNPDTKLLHSFFTEYADEVKEHMYLEDGTVFPYILALYNYSQNKKVNEEMLKYRIDDFIEHHSDIEEKLDDLKHLLIKYFPPTEHSFYRNMILLELYNLQYDLNDHANLEELILGPLVRELEKKTVGENG